MRIKDIIMVVCIVAVLTLNVLFLTGVIVLQYKWPQLLLVNYLLIMALTLIDMLLEVLIDKFKFLNYRIPPKRKSVNDWYFEEDDEW